MNLCSISCLCCHGCKDDGGEVAFGEGRPYKAWLQDRGMGCAGCATGVTALSMSDCFHARSWGTGRVLAQAQTGASTVWHKQ